MVTPGSGVVKTGPEAGHWQVGVAFRSFHAFRDFQGSTALPVPSPPELYASTYVQTFDVNATYAVNSRLALTFGAPLQFGSRRTYLEHDFVTAHTMKVSGLGDMRAAASMWLWDPASHSDANVSITTGLKLPTGVHGGTDGSVRSADQVVVRPADPAIQPGDGGWGWLLGAQAFTTINHKTTVFAQGTYLFNPRETNGTETPFGDEPEITFGEPGYTIDSVPDQYFFRAGVAHTLSDTRGFAPSVAFRLDGVPAHDALGSSEGYRLPGYAWAIEPGLSIGRVRNVFTLSVPIAIKRHASKSVTDVRTASPFGGIATLADYTLNVSITRRF
jgi:hypothetical protein